MSEFKTPLASETIKDLIFKSLPVLNIELNTQEINLIKSNYDADKLFSALVLLQKFTIEKKSKKELENELHNILKQSEL